MLLGSSPVSAGRQWCRSDPVIMINGEVADVLIFSLDAMADSATGPVEIVVTLPPDMSGSVLATDLGFGGYGYAIRFDTSHKLRATDSTIPIRIAVYAPATDTRLPVLVDFVPRSNGALSVASATGSANNWVKVSSGT
jgi:hypothetical protein